MKMKKILTMLAVSMTLVFTAACGTVADGTETQVQETETQDETQEEVKEEDKEEAKEETKEEAKEEVKEEAKEETKQEAKEETKQEQKDVRSLNNDKTEKQEEDKAEGTDKADESSTQPQEEQGPVVDREDIKTLETPVTKYSQRGLNIRKGPGTEFDIVGHLGTNDEVTVVGESKTTPWKEIKFNNETAFVHGGYIADAKVEIAPPPVQAQTQDGGAAQASQAPAPQAPAPQPKAAAGVLFIGDSRTCQMRDAVGGAGCGWICEYSTTYKWFAETAVPQADAIVGKGTKVVICMGVNDPGGYYAYAALANQKAADWNARGARVYFVSVNPVCNPYDDKTPKIDEFNANMPGLLSGVYWIDTASVIKQGGYVLEDGIHYDATGNVNIFNMICGCLR